MANSTITIECANGYRLGGQLVRYPKNTTGQLTFHGEGNSVSDVYGRPSAAKLIAELDIISEMNNAGGYGYMILGHNGFYFSCGYYVKDKAGALYFIKHTHASRYICECDSRAIYINSKRLAKINNTYAAALYLETFYSDVTTLRAVLDDKKTDMFNNIKRYSNVNYMQGEVNYCQKIIELCDAMHEALDVYEANGCKYFISWDVWAHRWHEEAELDAAADYIAAAWPCL